MKDITRMESQLLTAINHQRSREDRKLPRIGSINHCNKISIVLDWWTEVMGPHSYVRLPLQRYFPVLLPSRMTWQSAGWYDEVKLMIWLFSTISRDSRSSQVCQWLEWKTVRSNKLRQFLILVQLCLDYKPLATDLVCRSIKEVSAQRIPICQHKKYIASNFHQF